VKPVRRRRIDAARPVLRPQHAQRLEQFGANLVLAAVAATGRRGQRRAVPLTSVEHHQQAVVLVVGMRRGHHVDAGVGQVTQREPERDVPLLFVDRDHLHLRGGHRDERHEDGGGEPEMSLHDWIILWQERSPFLPFLPFLPIPP
jgi:hypothetical protein